jgi:hypothetical protein
MKRLALALALLIASLGATMAQSTVTVIGPAPTPGNIPIFNSNTVIKDSGIPASALPTGLANPTGAVGLTAVPGSAPTAMRSDAAPPLSASVQSALTGINGQILIGTGGFGFASIVLGGDCTFTSPNITCAKINGVSYGTNPSTDTVPVATAPNTSTYTAVPNCTTGVLQYSTATHLFSCGATGAGTLTQINQGVNTTANPGAGIILSTNPCTTTCTVSVDPTYLRGYISGLTLSNDGVTPNTVIDIAAGVSTSDDFTTLMKLASAITKNMNSTWVVGSTNGCADGAASYTTLGASTWYHLFEIERLDTGVVDVLCSKSATAPTLPASYTKQRRIGSVKTNASSQIIAFSQSGNDFLWKVMTNDNIGNNPGTGLVTLTVNTPLGVQTQAKIIFYLQAGDAARRCALITSPDQTQSAPVAGSLQSACAGVAGTSGIVSSSYLVRTNTSSQIFYQLDGSAAATSVFQNTYGWIDNL